MAVQKNYSPLFLAFSLIPTLTSSLYGCSNNFSLLAKESSSSKRFANSGSIIMSFPIKKEESRAEEVTSNNSIPGLIGYFRSTLFKDTSPSSIQNRHRIEISKEDRVLKFFDNNILLLTAKTEGEFPSNDSSTYKVTSKEFKKTFLDSENKKLMGAYGDYSITLNQNFIIHSSPVWNEEIGGLRISKVAAKKIFDTIDNNLEIQIIN